MPLVIGLTGNIGSGKSTVLQMLAKLGAQIIDADKLAHEVIAPDGPAYSAVVDAFGQDILKATGYIDRSKLGDIVFRDPQALARLEALVHPTVFARTQELIEQAGAEVVVVEAIKLLEAGLARQLCDDVWVVTCRPEQQRARVMAQRGLTEAQARLRIEAQPPQAEKTVQADVVIDNSGTMEETREQVRSAWQALKKIERTNETEGPEGSEVPIFHSDVTAPMTDVTIRRATVDDAAGVLHILNTIVRERRFTALDRVLTLEEEREFLQRRGPRDAIFVAEWDGRIISFQCIDPFMPDIASMAHVAQMGTYVLPTCRGQGIGRRLFEASCEFARRHGYEKIVIYVRAGNREAQSFYQRMGFQHCGRLRRQTHVGDEYEDEILFEHFLEEP